MKNDEIKEVENKISITIPECPQERLNLVIDTAWKILFERIYSGVQEVNKEATLQLHLAKLIFELGNVYCIKPNEQFKIVLEKTYEPNDKSKKMSIDIVCELNNMKAAIELKSYKQEHGAETDNSYRALEDVQRLQNFEGFAIRKFFCLTNKSYYAQAKKTGVIRNISLENGKVYKAYTPINYKDHHLEFKHDFKCNWTSKTDWHYLQIDVPC